VRDIMVGAAAKTFNVAEKFLPRTADRYMEKTMFAQQQKRNRPRLRRLAPMGPATVQALRRGRRHDLRTALKTPALQCPRRDVAAEAGWRDGEHMTKASRLERSYRSLLALYPKAYRRDHEQEILSVLMAAAPEGQTRPRLAEAADLVRSAIFTRLRQTQVQTPWEYRHARLMLPIRIVTGVWLVFLTALLYGSGRGGWWGVLLGPAAALHVYIAYRLIHRPEHPPGPARREGL
jgi:hypothetical protein